MKPLVQVFLNNVLSGIDRLVDDKVLPPSQRKNAKQLMRKTIRPEQPLEFLKELYQHQSNLSRLSQGHDVEAFVDRMATEHRIKLAPELKPHLVQQTRDIHDLLHRELAKPKPAEQMLEDFLHKTVVMTYSWRMFGLMSSNRQYSGLHQYSQHFTGILTAEAPHFVQQMQSEMVAFRSVSVNTPSKTGAFIGNSQPQPTLVHFLQQHGLFAQSQARSQGFTPRPKPGQHVDPRELEQFYNRARSTFSSGG